jgi:hypothetical protein
MLALLMKEYAGVVDSYWSMQNRIPCFMRALYRFANDIQLYIVTEWSPFCGACPLIDRFIGLFGMSNLQNGCRIL